MNHANLNKFSLFYHKKQIFYIKTKKTDQKKKVCETYLIVFWKV